MSKQQTIRVSDVVLGVALEGSADFFFGRPLEENPYGTDRDRSSLSWRHGWLEASWFNEMRADEEIPRWRIQ